MSYFTILCFCLLYFLTRLNFALASENAGSIAKSKYTKYEPRPLIRAYRPETDTLAKYVVSIRHKPNKRKVFGASHYCSGAILNAKWILTSVRCLEEKHTRITTPGELEVVAGTPKRLVKTAHSQIRDVVVVHVRRLYNDVYRRDIYDVGLLKLKNNLNLDGTYVEAIPLPKAPPKTMSICVCPRFGRLYRHGPYANEILYSNFTIIWWKICKDELPMYIAGDLCVTDEWDFKEKDSCDGDQGGPLICDGTVAGIFAGYGCNYNKPHVYTGVYKCLPWIKSFI